MDEEINFLLNKFPASRRKILSAYRQNEDFKILCHDFYTTAHVLEKLQLSIRKSIQGEIEYQRVFADLEKEIADYLISGDRRQPTLRGD